MKQKNKLMRIAVLSVMIGLGVSQASAFTADTDTLPTQQADSASARLTESVKPLVIPITFTVIGTIGVENHWFDHVRRGVREDMSRLRTDYWHGDDYLQYLPVVANVGLGVAGVKSKYDFRERLVMTATSYAVMGMIVNGLKYTIREPRPDTGAHNSFPSGHTATAFMGAELVRIEYGTGIGIAAYGIATGVGFLRLYNDRHWLNDVIAGCGIGILSAQIARLLLPWERNLLGWNKHCERTLAIMPTYDVRHNTAGVGLALLF